MALRAKKPEQIQKRLKVFLYGSEKVGKTTAAIQFPKPYLIDTERGAEQDKYTKMLNKGGGAIFQTSDFDEVIAEIKTLLTEQHEFKTLIIDPMTLLYDDLVDKCAATVGTDYGKHVALAGRKMKNLYSLLLRLDMNVVVTSHAKNEYQMNGKELVLIGTTFDCYKKMGYMFDLILEIQKRGKERVALVRGTRLEGFKEDETFSSNYDAICERYGREILEKDCQSVVLASPEQIKEVKHLIELLHIEQDMIDKMLKKEDVEDWSFTSGEHIQKCINYFKSTVQGEAA